MRATRREVLRKAGLAGSLIAFPAVAGAVISNRAEAAVCALSIEPDPIFALIEAHRAAAARVTLLDIDNDAAEFDTACGVETAAFLTFIRTAPTTLPGLIAYASMPTFPNLICTRTPRVIDPSTGEPMNVPPHRASNPLRGPAEPVGVAL